MPHSTQAKHPNTVTIVLVGLAALAAAMGIGRFAFTPILPLMQAAGELTLLQGSWLASANYLGYLVGALACIWLAPRPATWAKAGLLAVAVTTLAMAWPGEHMALWLLWRLLAGIASAFVLVGTSAWCLEKLSALQNEHLAGGVYAGVGVGIAVAGLAALGAGILTLHPNGLWLILGLVAAAVWLVCRRSLQPLDATDDGRKHRSDGFSSDSWRLIVCYGIFGLAYILPATFLPAMARDKLPDASLFGWVWPVFGVAAAVSTVVASRYFHDVRPRRVWAIAALIMTIGITVPVIQDSLAGLLVSALCVGGTFMIITMAGLQEARLAGGATLIAAMTASFASGQMIGPLLINLTAGSLAGPSLAAAALLLVTAILLWPAPAIQSPGQCP